ncbi:hypothetical protein QVD17_30717 [Tagetes erecta]|uniref:Uncharacterized protein n=1 Tax=Tagetes erecta TaxID=13708 RepID=A0AAD8K4T1_TARER|nr:hypothetical protein QVD17_30717 [Tagetes erecta]
MMMIFHRLFVADPFCSRRSAKMTAFLSHRRRITVVPHRRRNIAYKLGLFVADPIDQQINLVYLKSRLNGVGVESVRTRVLNVKEKKKEKMGVDTFNLTCF